MENKIDKKELLEQAGKLADKYADLKATISAMCDDLDKIEIEYTKIIELIKKK